MCVARPDHDGCVQPGNYCVATQRSTCPTCTGGPRFTRANPQWCPAPCRSTLGLCGAAPGRYTRAHTRARAHVDCFHVHTYTHAYTRDTHTCARIHTHKQTHAHTHTHTHTLTLIHTHAHTRHAQLTLIHTHTHTRHAQGIQSRTPSGSSARTTARLNRRLQHALRCSG